MPFLAPRTLARPTLIAVFVAVVAAVLAAALVLATTNSPALAGGFLAGGVIVAGAAIAFRLLRPAAPAASGLIDWDFARQLVQVSDDPVAVTDRAGRLVCANDAYQRLFDDLPTPPGLPLSDDAVEALSAAARTGWRDGEGGVAAIEVAGVLRRVEIARAGSEGDLLVWRFLAVPADDVSDGLLAALQGEVGDRLGRAGVMVAMVDREGRVLAANGVLARRALGRTDVSLIGRDFANLLITDSRGLVRFEREGLEGTSLRIMQLPFGDDDVSPFLVALLDEEDAAPAVGDSAAAHVRSLVALLPLGLALVDRDGRLLQMNDAFVRAAQVDPGDPPIYPGDLVVREDKAAVADAIRRFAGGATHSADMAVRLKNHPDEPIALTIAGARGLGDAGVLLSLKDNSEESRLKREVAQATKMQAVGQLAGGVAHDFNNILTAIIGHCDLMMMRHSPGDSDYDDIQQIRTNSNRAAGLTRQLLAFSRQQTLRPQVLQLPDVVSEVSNLLKRLMGETVRLDVSHGRNLGPVRADPGQLEQVVVNLAVNARDAIVAANPRGGGVLTIQTKAVTATEVRALGNEVLPPADYTALVVTDTGHGIPADIIGKIFEPFFTTKELGKGTGLGLSTVYGIVKQSGGWIFADSLPGKGAAFSIYLPVHAAGAVPRPRAIGGQRPPARPVETWGTGTVLLVEDEDMVRAVAERALARQGYQVLTADNGEAALEMLETSGRPDLLISDVVMPTMDGPTMVRRARERYPDLPVLFMSGYAEEQLRKSIDLAHVAFLPKPFSVQQLAEAARDALVRG